MGSGSKSGSGYYDLLGVPQSASPEDIRRAYRLRSKLYHPDTTSLCPEIAIAKFQELNEAYSVLNSAERRRRYDQQIEFGSGVEHDSPDSFIRRTPVYRGKDYPAAEALNPRERPLSPGEQFALFLLGLTFFACLALALILGFSRGEMVLQASTELETFKETWSDIVARRSGEHLPANAAADVPQIPRDRFGLKAAPPAPKQQSPAPTKAKNLPR